MATKSKEELILGASVEFDGFISDKGTIELPSPLKGLRGSGVRIRLRSLGLAGSLQAKGVTDEEVARIAALQVEPQDVVVRFLLSEGALRGGSEGGSR